MKWKWTFDDYLGNQLIRLAFVRKGNFTIQDIKEYLSGQSILPGYLNKLYRKEKPYVYWNWDSYTDRMNRHIYRVVKSLGGARQKIRNRWVYSLSPDLFIKYNRTNASA